MNNKNFNIFISQVARQRGILPTAIYLGHIQSISPHPVWGGGFADVYQGRFNCQLVALKVPRIFGEGETELLKVRTNCSCILLGLLPMYPMQELLKEVSVWRSLSHKYVLPFYGITMEAFQPRVAMVSPWLQYGHLRSFLKRRPDADKFTIVSSHNIRFERVYLLLIHTLDVPSG